MAPDLEMADGSSPRAPSTRVLVVVLATVVALSVGLPLLMAIRTGSLSIPHNDAWAHSRIAEHFARTGRLELVGWNRTALVGQIVVLGPLGASIMAQQLFVAVTAIVALLATYGFLRECGVRPWPSVLAAAAIGLLPDFGLLSTSYMSDIPAFAALMVSAWLTGRGLRTQQVAPMVGALLIGLWGVTIREQDVVAPVVTLLAALMTWRGRRRWFAVALVVLSVVALAWFELWRRQLAFGDPPTAAVTPRRGVESAIESAYTLSLMAAPISAMLVRPSLWSRRTRLAALAVTALAGLYAYLQGGQVILGTAYDRSGPSALASIGAAEVWPGWVRLLIVAVACAGMGGLVGVVLDGSVRVRSLPSVALLLLLAGNLVEPLIGQDIFSRSLLPVLPFLAAALLVNRQVASPSAAVGVLAAAGVLGLLITANGLAYDAARWHSATDLVDRGVAAQHVDAGLEWVGYRSGRPADQTRLTLPADGTLGWWERMFTDSRECYVVSGSAQPGHRLVGSQHYQRFVFFGRATMHTYANLAC